MFARGLFPTHILVDANGPEAGWRCSTISVGTGLRAVRKEGRRCHAPAAHGREACARDRHLHHLSGTDGYAGYFEEHAAALCLPVTDLTLFPLFTT